MAIRPDYTIGTLTMTSGSSDFTTSGSSLLTAAVQPGDAIIAPSGHILIIASITGQNSGTLFLPCPSAAAGTDLPLRIRFQPDGSRYQGAVRDLVEKLANGVLENIADIPVEDGNLLIGNAAGQYEPISKDDLGIQDPNGSLGELAALALAANKILNTDASGNLTQSDITASALVLLKLAGAVGANKLPFFDSANSAALTNFTAAARALLNLSGTAVADKFPYFTGQDGALLTDLTPQARTMLASTTPAIASLGYMPVNKSGDSMVGTLGLRPTVSNSFQLDNSIPIVLANGAGIVYENFSGMMLINSHNGPVSLWLVGGGIVTKVAETTPFQIVVSFDPTNSRYGITNETGISQPVTITTIRTRPGA
ncbi:hypothetical protein [Brucella sp. 2280]|uniref:hypothetical protein n=1 Tax=Brucella sp. 2280 TaxID=2592625 RepID=UPI00129666E1|nr:hypothetical protein [Brucella sp. 2280]QGA55842.1 hypothetical protein GHC20_01565 [Brucella sp. 2280]